MRQNSAHRRRARWNRLIVVFASAAAVTTLESVRAEEFTPYRARVVTASAPVLCGPGENFYSTDTLAEGEFVDVYKRQANGWCAIRPPEGSFSWIFGRHLKNSGNADSATDALAEIDKDDVASRIGSRLSGQRNAVQVRLKKGEVVQVLGQETSDGQTWYKVSPPAGEFRWIHSRMIERIGPIPSGSAKKQTDEPRNATESAVSNAVAIAPVGSTSADTTPIASAIPADAYGAAVAQPVAKQLSADQWRAAPEKAAGNITAPPLAAPPADKVPAEKATGTDSKTESEKAAAKTTATESAPTDKAPSNNTSGGPPDVRARSSVDLELRLSRMVAEPPTTWNTDLLKSEAEALLAQAQTPAERGAVQATLVKIDRFAAIEHRYRGATGGAGDARQFDAVGVLRPVTSRRPGAPPFALVDERGQVLSFVTPTPGVNLQSFLGQRIGVTGNRGYIPEFQRAHVMAGRVAPVPDRIIR